MCPLWFQLFFMNEIFIRHLLCCWFQTRPPSPYHHQLVLAYHLLFQILRKLLNQGCLRSQADGMVLFPIFWYQCREALNSGSVHNSFAFKRRINLVTAAPAKHRMSSHIFRSLFGLVLTTSETDQSQGVILTAIVNMVTRSI